MQSLYSDADAAAFVAKLGPTVSEPLALRTYTARLLGASPSLVLHGGGNTSVKAKVTSPVHGEVDVLHVKGSGWDLATIEPPGHPAVRLAPLVALRRVESLSDEAMVSELRASLLDAAAPTPSVETLLHAFLPHRFVDHTHADAILSVSDQPDCEALCRRIFGDSLVWVPYVMPGFPLGRRCMEVYDAHVARGKRPGVMVLQRHGLFTFGATAKESYEAMIEAVTRAEGYLAESRRTVAVHGAPRASSDVEVAGVLHALRGALAKVAGAEPERGPLLHVRESEAVLAFLRRGDAKELTSIGCATPDHVIRTKPTPLFLELEGVAPDALAGSIEAQLRAYAKAYDAYFAAMCRDKRVSPKRLDPWPRVVLVPGVGIVTVGKTAVETTVAADVYEHTVDVIEAASDIGAYRPVSLSDLFDVEYWSLEQAKLGKSTSRPLAQTIAVVTGAASGIGRATASRLVGEGAHVVLVDRHEEKLREAATSFKGEATSRVAWRAADVTSAQAVDAVFTQATLRFGGVDVVVSNAGSAPIGDLHDDASDKLLRDSIELNLLSHNHVARAAVRVFRAQGRGGCLLFNASKAAFAPGPHFGPYAVAKTALLGLMRQYALDAAPFGVRSNAVNADRIRTGLFDQGVAEARAAARGLTVDAYFRSNLLAREVTADDVADAFVYLARARATTGCVVTVDGGNPAAFPR